MATRTTTKLFNCQCPLVVCINISLIQTFNYPLFVQRFASVAVSISLDLGLRSKRSELVIFGNIPAAYFPLLAHLSPSPYCLGNIIELTPHIVNPKRSGPDTPSRLRVAKLHPGVTGQSGPVKPPKTQEEQH